VTVQYHLLMSISEVLENHLRSGTEIDKVENPCQGETANHGWHR